MLKNFTHLKHILYQNLKQLPDVSIRSICSQQKVLKWHWPFIQVNLQGQFCTCVSCSSMMQFHDAWVQRDILQLQQFYALNSITQSILRTKLIYSTLRVHFIVYTIFTYMQDDSNLRQHPPKKKYAKGKSIYPNLRRPPKNTSLLKQYFTNNFTHLM